MRKRQRWNIEGAGEEHPTQESPRQKKKTDVRDNNLGMQRKTVLNSERSKVAGKGEEHAKKALHEMWRGGSNENMTNKS